MRYFEAAVLAIVGIAFSFFAVELGIAAHEVSKTVIQVKLDEHSEALKADMTLTDVSRAVVIVAGIASNTEKASRSWTQKQNQLADQANMDLNTLNGNLKQMDTLLSAGSGLLSHQDTALSSTQAAIRSSLTNLDALAESAKPTLRALDDSSAEIASSIHEAAPSLIATSKNLNETSAQLAMASKDAREVSDAYKEKLLHPVRSFWRELKSVGDFLVEGLEARAYWP